MRELNLEEIRSLLIEVGDELGGEGPAISIVIVGGTLMAMHGLRDRTIDVDTISEIEYELATAIRVVAERNKLPHNWLNQSSKPFAPESFSIDDCEEVLQTNRLSILALPIRQLFLMKLDSNRRTDQNDLMLLWPHSGFQHVEEVLHEYELAYPHTQRDEFLGEWIQQIIDRAEGAR